jgi:hypothetical protein
MSRSGSDFLAFNRCGLPVDKELLHLQGVPADLVIQLIVKAGLRWSDIQGHARVATIFWVGLSFWEMTS